MIEKLIKHIQDFLNELNDVKEAIEELNHKFHFNRIYGNLMVGRPH